MYAFRFLVHKNELTKSSIFDEVVEQLRFDNVRVFCLKLSSLIAIILQFNSSIM